MAWIKTMTYRLFLDDERWPAAPHNNGGFGDFDAICRNVEGAEVLLASKGLPLFISFDHDLGANARTGYDFAHMLVVWCLEFNIPPTFKWYVHSQNPIGKKNIEALLTNFQKQYGE